MKTNNGLAEILTGRSCVTFEIEQVKGPLAAHKACMSKHEHKTSIVDWPEGSPVRKAILAHNEAIDAKAGGAQ